jgi:hypothetical protein
MQYMTVLRQDPASLLFIQQPGQVPMEVLPDGAKIPAVQDESYTVGGAPYQPFTAYSTSFSVPDIRMGDTLLDPQDRDPATNLPWQYSVALVRRWKNNHLECALRRAAKASDISAFNAGRLLSFSQTCTWLQRITDQTPGAQASPSFDPYRQQVTSLNDGTYGVGWQAMQNGQLRKGYLAPQTITIGLNTESKVEEWTEAGLTYYDSTGVVYYQLPTVLAKGDLLVMPAPDNRRFRVADQITSLQVYGQTVLYVARLETPAASDIDYQVPTT